MTSLVGYTGFVGGNLYLSAGGKIQGLYHSRNIEEAYGTKPELLIYAGLPAEKYLANHDPKKDRELIREAEANIEKINPKRLVLISTIDVFKEPKGVDETSLMETEGLHPYGANRYQLELWARRHCPSALIIRLPGLFGRGIKKNFIYDYMHVIPSMLKAETYRELAASDHSITAYYEAQGSGFFKVKEMDDSDREALKHKFLSIGFSALNFTDSRSRYQFYNLERLWTDLQTALQAGIRLWHPATEPVSAAEIYQYLTGETFVNELGGTPADYDYRTIYDTVFGGAGGYISEKAQVLEQIKEFVRGR